MSDGIGKTLDIEEKYGGVERIFLFVEDEFALRKNMKESVERYLADKSGLASSVVRNGHKALQELRMYREYSPGALAYACLDYNMRRNRPGERRPTEILFYDDGFKHFLGNGGIVVMFSGYIEQVKQSETIMRVQHEYPNVLLLLAEKGEGITVDEIVRVMNSLDFGNMPRGSVERIRRVAEQRDHNLGKILAAVRRKKG